MLAFVVMVTILLNNANGTNIINADQITPKNTLLSSYDVYEETPGFLIRAELIRRPDATRLNGIKIRVEHYDQLKGGNLLDSYQIISGSEEEKFFNVFIRTDVWKNDIKRIDVLLDEDVPYNVGMPSSNLNIGRISARYSAEGGTFSNGTQRNSVPSYINGKLTMFDGYEEPTKENAEFSHWVQVKGSSNVVWDTAAMVIPESERTSNVMLFMAVWNDLTPTHTVGFESNGGSSVDPYTDVEKGTTIIAPKNVSKRGHQLDGWYTDAAFTIPWDFELDTVDDSMTLYAKWTPEKYNVKFVDAANTLLVEFKDVIYNNSVPSSYVDGISKSGHTYKIYVNQALTTQWVSEGYAVSEDVTFYVDYTKEQFTLSFETNGGSPLEPMNLEFGSLIGNSHATTKSGYTFDGWFLDSGLTTPLTNTTVINENMTIYAQWKEISVTEKVTLTFEANGGSELAPIVFEKGSKIGTNHSTTKKGYTFGGWFKDAELEHAVKNDTTITENMIIYAKWNKNTDAVLPATGMSSSDYIFVGLAIAFVGFGITFMSKKRDKE